MTKLRKGTRIRLTAKVKSYYTNLSRCNVTVFQKNMTLTVQFVEYAFGTRLVYCSWSGMLWMFYYNDLAANCVPVKTKRRGKR